METLGSDVTMEQDNTTSVIQLEQEMDGSQVPEELNTSGDISRVICKPAVKLLKANIL